MIAYCLTVIHRQAMARNTGLIVVGEESADDTRPFILWIEGRFPDTSWVVREPKAGSQVNCDVAIICVDKKKMTMLRDTEDRLIRQLNKKLGRDNIMVVVYNEEGDMKIASGVMKNAWPVLSLVKLHLTDEPFNENKEIELSCEEFLKSLNNAVESLNNAVKKIPVIKKEHPIERDEPDVITTVCRCRGDVNSDTKFRFLFFMQFILLLLIGVFAVTNQSSWNISSSGYEDAGNASFKPEL